MTACPSTLGPATPTHSEHTGAIEALAHYWLTRFEYEETGDKRAAPEFNLETAGAGITFAERCKRLGATPPQTNALGTGFEVGLRFAAIIARDPLNCERDLIRILNELLGQKQLASLHASNTSEEDSK